MLLAMIYSIDYKFPEDEILSIFNQRFNKMPEWQPKSDFYKEVTVTGLKTEQVFDDIRLTKIVEEFFNHYNISLDENFEIQFYHLEPFSVLPTHIDEAPTTAAINLVLSGDTTGVIFDDKEYIYHCAVLNVLHPHGVKNQSTARILFRIVFLGLSYDQIVSKIRKV